MAQGEHSAHSERAATGLSRVGSLPAETAKDGVVCRLGPMCRGRQ